MKYFIVTALLFAFTSNSAFARKDENDSPGIGDDVAEMKVTDNCSGDSRMEVMLATNENPGKALSLLCVKGR